jgi:hypothetical protein
VRQLVAAGKLAAVRFSRRGHLRFLEGGLEGLLERSRRREAAEGPDWLREALEE